MNGDAHSWAKVGNRLIKKLKKLYIYLNLIIYYVIIFVKMYVTVDDVSLYTVCIFLNIYSVYMFGQNFISETLKQLLFIFSICL